MKTTDGITPNLKRRPVRRVTGQLLVALDQYVASTAIDDMVRTMMSQAGVVDITTHDSNGVQEWIPCHAGSFRAIDWAFKLGLKLGSVRRVNDRMVLHFASAWLIEVVRCRK
jgi:hypothetical protein